MRGVRCHSARVGSGEDSSGGRLHPVRVVVLLGRRACGWERVSCNLGIDANPHRRWVWRVSSIVVIDNYLIITHCCTISSVAVSNIYDPQWFPRH